MNLMDLIEKARELIGGGGVDNLADSAGELSDITQGESSVVDKAQQALETLGEGGGEGRAGGAESPGGSEQR
jgi:hypothetical protein